MYTYTTIGIQVKGVLFCCAVKDKQIVLITSVRETRDLSTRNNNFSDLLQNNKLSFLYTPITT